MSEKTVTNFPIAAIVRLLKKNGVERASRESIIAMDSVLGQVGATIATGANQLAQHAKRKTIKADDIELAWKQ
jgi:histone H3/H4